MFLSRIRVENYRNITVAEMAPSRQLTLIHGLNGQGKTNLLESIYILGNGRPFRVARIPDIIRKGQPNAMLSGQVEAGKLRSNISLFLEGKTRRVSVDGKSVHRASDLHGKLGVIVFSPDDTAMAKQGPEIRRRYLDRALYSTYSGFLKDYHDYYRTLKQRNTLLKSGKSVGLDIWTEQLADAGTRLMSHRERYVGLLRPRFQEHYRNISGGRESVDLAYSPDIDCSRTEWRDCFADRLRKSTSRDIQQGSTGHGPHRDDLDFLIEGTPLKTFGSQGQQRSFVLALKLAELDNMQETLGEPPVMLLDDIASELDKERINNLLSFLGQMKVQVFITTTTMIGIDTSMLHEGSIYRMDAGTLTYEGNVSR